MNQTNNSYKDHSKEIFNLLGIKSMEKFKIKALRQEKQKEYDGIFYLSSNLVGYYKGWGCKDYTDYTILPKLLSGELKIVKELTTKNISFTKEEQTVIDYLKLCGYKYIARDDNGKIYAYEFKPTKDDYRWLAEDGGKVLYLEYDLSFVSWEDNDFWIIE